MNSFTKMIALCAVGALAMTGCARGDSDSEGGTASGPVPADSCPADALAAVPEGEPIKIGVSLAQSGPMAVVNNVALAIDAVFKEANEAGGVEGHPLELVVKDDAFETARAVTNVRELIDSEQVTAMAAQVGTPLVAATQSFAEESCTPQLWTATGVSEIAANPEEHPFTTANLMPYETEAELWIRSLTESGRDDGRIVLVTTDDDRATVFEQGVRDAIEGTDFELVGTEQVAAAAPSVSAQVNGAMAQNPDVVLLGTNTTSCPPLITGLRRADFGGQVIVNNTCAAIKSNFMPIGAAANGVQVLTVTDDPANPVTADDPEMLQYRETLGKFAPQADVDSSYTAGGYQIGHLMLDVLKEAAGLDGGLNRVNVMNAAWTIDTETPIGPAGAKTSLDWVDDPNWRDEVQLMEYQHGEGLLPVVDVISIN